MGKGDKKTKRGKISQGSYGVTRPQNKRNKKPADKVLSGAVKTEKPVKKDTAPKKEAAPKKVAAKKETTEKKVAVKKTAKKKSE